MNRTILSALMIATVALTGCSKNKWWPSTGAKVELTLTIVSSSPATKTFIEEKDGHVYARWSTTDKLKVYFDGWQDGEKPLYDMSNTSEDKGNALFQGLAKDVLDGSHNILAISANGFKEVKAERKVLFELDALQKLELKTVDPMADIVVNRPYQQLVNSTDNSIAINDMRFHRLLSTIKTGVINNTSKNLSGEKVNTMKLESKASGVTFSGSFIWDFDSESVSIQQGSPVLDAVFSSPLGIDSEDYALLLSLPTTIPSGSTLVATFITDNYRITKTIQTPQELNLVSNKVVSLTFKLNDSDTVIQNL